jgi:hypothetical protein
MTPLILTVWETRVNANSITTRHRVVTIPVTLAFEEKSSVRDIAAVLDVRNVFIPDAAAGNFA